MRRPLASIMLVASTMVACTTPQSSGAVTSATPTAGEMLSTAHVETFDETGQSPKYVIHAEWPILDAPTPSLADFNTEAKGVAEAEIDRFREGLLVLPAVPQSEGSDFRLTYSLVQNTDTVVVVHYVIDQYQDGAATSVRYSRTLNYSPTLKRPLVLAELFRPDTNYVTRLAELANEGLKAQGYSRDTSVPLIAPDAAYFEAWLVVPEGLRFVYSPLICCGPAGEGETVVPVEAVRDILDPAFDNLWN